MRTSLFAAALSGALMLASTAPAEAAFSFGEDEDIHVITDVGVKGQDQEALELGYKTTTQNFLLPYTIKDDGYVLVQKADHERYYSVTPDQLKAWQLTGLVPDPLPPYKLSTLDQIFGHILWPTLVLIAIVYGISYLRKKKRVSADGSPVPDDKGPIS